MNKKIGIDCLSTNRTFLMGIAILQIYFCHTNLYFGVLNTINQYAVPFFHSGVGIFLLLSGLGCYFSYSNCKSIKIFYYKRIFRILPAYLIVVLLNLIFVAVIYRYSFNDILRYLYDYSLISFFISGKTEEWYVAAILALYLIFPLVYKLINKNAGYIVIISIVLYLAGLIVMCMPFRSMFFSVCDMFISRIPVFFLGVIIGKCIYEKRTILFDFRICLTVFIILTLLFLVICYLNYNCINSSLFHATFLIKSVSLGLVPFMCINLSYFLNKIEGKNKIIKFINFLGTITLEFYLIHNKVLNYSDIILSRIFDNEILKSVLVYVLTFVISILLSYLVHRIVSNFFNNNKAKKLKI